MKSHLAILGSKSAVYSRVFLAILILGIPLVLAGNRVNAQSIRTSRDANPKIAMGQFPPDFTLPRLRFETNGQGKPVGVIDESDTIQLSSFRGKKPVCLIMSSYT